MVQEVLSVPDVSCNHCVSAIEGAVGGLQGVQSGVEVAPRRVGVRLVPGDEHRGSIFPDVVGLAIVVEVALVEVLAGRAVDRVDAVGPGVPNARGKDEVGFGRRAG